MIRDDATQRQIWAADPEHSTWVSANAGSGKTRVLTDRVARLLLGGVDPQNILCLTYTKAAATEMQNRLFDRLGSWAMMQEKQLRHELTKLGYDKKVTLNTLDDARRLFASAIETPGGLKIQTIHSFCASLLRRFPLEAGVSPQFHEMEDQTARLLRRDVLDGLSTGPHAAETKALMSYFTGNDLDSLLAEITKRKDVFAGSPSKRKLLNFLGIDASDTTQSIIRSAIRKQDEDLAKRIEKAFADQTKTYTSFAAELLSIDYNAPALTDFELIKGLFLYSKDQTSKSVNFPLSSHKKAVVAAAPIAGDLHAWMDRVADAHQKQIALEAFNATSTLWAFSKTFVAHYEAAKTARGLQDFDDLIGKARSLLRDPDVAQWILFRLDGRLDHILVDEAQDTSPEQWDVVRHLTQEFAVGHGSKEDVERTIFVVGDKQQSIYSFQGADPNAFDQMKDHFDQSLSRAGQSLESVKLSHSFRSSQAILTTVDNTFVGDRAEAIGKVQDHIAFKSRLPGRVDLWPLIQPQSSDDLRPNWTDPVDQVSEAHHTVQLADRIAMQISHMIENETLPVEAEVPGQFDHRPITPGDIMILVQRRSALFHEIIAACKRAKLPIAGADRLRVGAELAVKDLTAVLQFLALPEDDLSLACALRSPLFGWSEEQLYDLAQGRKETFLWHALRDAGDCEALRILQDMRGKADFMRPYDLIERLLTRHEGRKRILARLGQEAEDGIDALLAQALSYESTETPSLTGFLVWMQTDDLEVKRQMDSQGDRIRVMTVHGSKGLEAPIVILPDCAKRQTDLKENILVEDDLAIWKTTANKTPASIKALKAAKIENLEAERLRLLYVAMTRAECWLIVAAAGEVDETAWYNIVSDGMTSTGDSDAQSFDMTVRRVEHLDWRMGEKKQQRVTQEKPEVFPLFPEVAPVSRIGTLSPSDLGGEKVLPGDVPQTDEDAKLRGSAIHVLLEHLPNYPEAQHPEIGRRLLSLHGMDDDTYSDLPEQVSKLLSNPKLHHLFGPGSYAEADITASLPSLGVKMTGIIDRMIVTEEGVLAVDFKTNRIVPQTAQDTPDGILRQMGAYAEALKQIYPDRKIATAILWTETENLMTLPAALTSEALSRVTVS